MTLQEARAKIDKVDLGRIEKRLKRQGFDQERLDKAVRMYRKYLSLLVMYPDLILGPPSLDADEVWHAHILHTKKYHDDCAKLFGSYRHHLPMDDDDPARDAANNLIKELWDKHGLANG